MSEKITLVVTSLNPDRKLLNRMLDSVNGFDEQLLHIDNNSMERLPIIERNGKPLRLLRHSRALGIGEAYNWIIEEQVKTEWICCFCDDDYFYPGELIKMINEVHKGIDVDVAHFKFHISGHVPPEDLRCLFGKKEYDLCEKKTITPKFLERHNRMPAGSFFRKSAWEKVGGFQGDKYHDWDLWKRMANAGCRFKYFDHLVYNHVRRENSAWCRQNA